MRIAALDRTVPLASDFAAAGHHAAAQNAASKKAAAKVLKNSLFPDGPTGRKKLSRKVLDFALLLHLKKLLTKADFAAVCDVALQNRADPAAAAAIPAKVKTALEAAFAVD